MKYLVLFFVVFTFVYTFTPATGATSSSGLPSKTYFGFYRTEQNRSFFERPVHIYIIIQNIEYNYIHVTFNYNQYIMDIYFNQP